MRFSILLSIFVSIVVYSKQQLQKEEEEDRRELMLLGGVGEVVGTILLVCVLGPAVTGAAGASMTWALNAYGQAQVTNTRSDIYLENGRYGRRFRGSARRLLASGADSGTGACPADNLRLPVEITIVDSGVISYRVPDSMANIDTTGCSFWWGTYAKKFNLGPLAPPKCLENKLKSAQTVTQTAIVKRKVATSDNKPGPAVMHSKEPTIYKDPKLVQGEAVQTKPVLAAQKVQNFPTWQLWGVMVIAVVLLLVTCFASSQQKEVDVYSPLKQNVDEF